MGVVYHLNHSKVKVCDSTVYHVSLDTKFAPTVRETSFSEERHRCVEVAAPYKLRLIDSVTNPNL